MAKKFIRNITLLLCIMVYIVFINTIVYDNEEQFTLEKEQSTLGQVQPSISELDNTLNREVPVQEFAIQVQYSKPETTYLISENYSVSEVSSLPDNYSVSYDLDGTVYYFTDSQWSDIDHLARISFAESGNQCYDGRLAVASVVMNRVLCSYYNFGSDVLSVLSAPNQFHAYDNSNYRKTPFEENIEIAVKSYLGMMNLPSNVLFFRATTSTADWGNYKYYTTIDDVAFYTYG